MLITKLFCGQATSLGVSIGQWISIGQRMSLIGKRLRSRESVRAPTPLVQNGQGSLYQIWARQGVTEGGPWRILFRCLRICPWANTSFRSGTSHISRIVSDEIERVNKFLQVGLWVHSSGVEFLFQCWNCLKPHNCLQVFLWLVIYCEIENWKQANNLSDQTSKLNTLDEGCRGMCIQYFELLKDSILWSCDIQ